MKHKHSKSYVNQSFATDLKTKQRNDTLGNFFNSIDFSLSPTITEQSYKPGVNPVIGSLLIGSYEIPLTYSECNRIMETLAIAQHTHRQKKNLNVF
jgi:hypothetical protein